MRIVAGSENLAAIIGGSLDAVAQRFFEKRLHGSRFPMESRDLASAQSGERIAVPEGVVEKGQFVIARERRQPQRKLGQIDRHLVFVDTIEAALCDQSPCM